jgi:hypothetical protein
MVLESAKLHTEYRNVYEHMVDSVEVFLPNGTVTMLRQHKGDGGLGVERCLVIFEEACS